MASPAAEDVVVEDLASGIAEILRTHPQVLSVRLVGSRARGDATAHSDWDFRIDVLNFAALAADLPKLVEPLRPLAQLWDPLSHHRLYALVLPGPVKVDLLFNVPQVREAPWDPSAETLPAIDAHFWDWLLWLVGKRHRGKHDLVGDELAKMYDHLLRPLGVAEAPTTLEYAFSEYLAARDQAERRFRVHLPRDLQEEVRSLLEPSR